MATVVGLLVNPTNPNLAEPTPKNLRAAAHTLGLQLHILNASTDRDFDTVFATLIQLQLGALVIGADPFFSSRLEQLAALNGSSRRAHGLPVSRVHSGRRPHELRSQFYGHVTNRTDL